MGKACQIYNSNNTPITEPISLEFGVNFKEIARFESANLWLLT